MKKLFVPLLILFISSQLAFAQQDDSKPEGQFNTEQNASLEINSLQSSYASLKKISEGQYNMMTGVKDQYDELQKRLDQISKDLTKNNPNSALAKDIETNKKELANQSQELTIVVDNINSIQDKLKKQDNTVGSSLSTNSKDIDNVNNTIGTIQSDVSNFMTKIEDKLAQVELASQTKPNYVLFMIIATLFGFSFLLLFLINKSNSQAISISNELEQLKKNLSNNSLDNDTKLIELLEKNLEHSKNIVIAPVSDDETQHTLPLKVGNEIHRMRKRIENMPQETTGLKALSKALERLEEELVEQGYEIVKLEGEKYVDGLTINPRFVSDENLNPGEQIITKVTKPQINYKGIISQVADVEVSIGE